MSHGLPWVTCCVRRTVLGGYKGGPKRAAFWRAPGFPNLVLARAAKARNRTSDSNKKDSSGPWN
jgi:hypothetical protein